MLGRYPELFVIGFVRRYIENPDEAELLCWYLGFYFMNLLGFCYLGILADYSDKVFCFYAIYNTDL